MSCVLTNHVPQLKEALRYPVTKLTDSGLVVTSTNGTWISFRFGPHGPPPLDIATDHKQRYLLLIRQFQHAFYRILIKFFLVHS